ncbi:MAG: DUF1080 domain-containing protein [Planctomycetes bacterium]|nr:DUF1080 domain-containing protein [Planctomycetota bacterium]
MIALTLALAALPQATQSDYYTVDFLPSPPGEVLEVGGLDFFSDGRLAVSTRRGQVWIVENAMAEDPADARFHLFAEGLFEGLGLEIVNDELYVLQRTELSKLVDVDGDGTCDDVECVSNDWGYSGNYHEFAYGLPVDADGNFYLSLNVGFFNPEWWHGKSVVKDRGWLLRVHPDGVTEPFAFGMRSPCGLGFDTHGNLFYTDNQGDWMPVCPIFHAQYGRFYGHPAALNWTHAYLDSQTIASDTVPPERARERAAAWIPYDWSRSTGNLVPDTTGGRFGPFEDQLIVSELTNGRILRADFERVRGEYQGAVFPLLEGVGSTIRVRFAPDGTLFTGLTNRGWGGVAPADGVGRVRWTGVTPFSMKTVRLRETGFVVELTEPVDPATVPAAADVKLYDYDYDYWWEYGSPVRDQRDLAVERVSVSDDGRWLTFVVPDLTAGRVMRGRFAGLRSASGKALLTDEFAYTVNQIPGHHVSQERVAKTVPPPPKRATGQQGWLRLTYGDALDAWDSSGWELCDAELDPADPHRFVTTKGVNALCNTAAEHPSEYVSKAEFGDVQVRLAFMLPEGGNSGLYLMGRYEVQLRDSAGVLEPGPGDCGGIYAGPTWPGSPPLRNAYSRAGVWHELDVTFRAPRFDAAGNKVANARFERVAIDDVTVQEDVEVPEATRGAWPGEVARGPLRLQGDHGPVGIGNVRVKALAPDGEAPPTSGWTSLLPEDDDLAGWTRVMSASWTLDDADALVSGGGRGWLFREHGLPRDVELRARCKLNDGGRAALVLGARDVAGQPTGYELVLNASFPSPEKTGSLLGLAELHTHFVPPDTWFDVDVTCRAEEGGTRLRVALNGVVVNDVLAEGAPLGDGLALYQHHEGTVLELERLEVRALDGE